MFTLLRVFFIINGCWILSSAFSASSDMILRFSSQPLPFYFFLFSFISFLIYFIEYAITVVPFPGLYSPPPCTPFLLTFPPFSSCPWVVHISSLASYTILTLPLSIFYLPFMLLIPCTFYPISPSHSCLLYTSDAADDWLVV